MDPDRFDRLTKTLAAGMSRRRVLRGFIGGALGAVALRQEAGATSFTGACHARCQPEAVRDRRACYDACLSCSDADQVCHLADGSFTCCPSGQACQNGTCRSGHPFDCFCRDTTIHTCELLDCVYLDQVCADLCAKHGGIVAGDCVFVTCVP